MSTVQAASFILPYSVLAELLARHCGVEDGPLPVDLKVTAVHVRPDDDQALGQCRVFATSEAFGIVPRDGAIYRLGVASPKESQYRFVEVPVDANVTVEKQGGGVVIQIQLDILEGDEEEPS